MPAPVLTEKKSQNIAMTAPVLISDSDNAWTVAFVIPNSYTIKTVPKPTNKNIKLVENPQKKIAIIKFSGLMSKDSIYDNTQKLKAWILNNKLEAILILEITFFLYLENDDLCLRKKKEDNKIYVAKKAKVQHLGARSHSPIYEKEIEFSRNWHWMWSKFYFNKKHYSYSKAILIGLPALINSMIKLFYYFITHNKFKKKVYTMRFLGLINSMFGKKSWYRPQI